MMKNRLIIYILAIYTCFNLYAEQEWHRQRGKSMFTYDSYAPFANRPVDVHCYIPRQGDIREMPILFVFEGGDRGYRYLLDGWKEEAERHGFMLFIPHFDLKAYPLSDYQEAGVMNETYTRVKDAGERTPAVVDKIFEHVRKETKSHRKGYMIYGHSAGGQFVQRFMLFHESPYIEKAIIGCPGWYTFPDTTQLFPYGVKNIPDITPERIQRYLSKDITLQLGLGDTVRESYLRKTPEAEWQGRNRLERGRHFYRFIHRLAEEKGWECNWRKVEEEGIGHIAVPMGQRAASLLMQDSIRALFIGNSYTFFNRMPKQLQAIAHSCGKPLSVKQTANPGWRLKQHLESPKSTGSIEEGGWDYVVLQEQSKAPAQERQEVETQVYPAATSLDSLRRIYAPKGKTVFYMTWGRDNETFDSMQQRLAESYLELTERLDARCAPVGIAWKRVRQERPDLKLHKPDQSHPTKAGSYLTACVFYTTFFSEPFSSDYYDGLPEEDARYLQRIAQEVVLSNPVLWNHKKSQQPQAVTERFYPDSAPVTRTPTLSKPQEEGIASLNEIYGFLDRIGKEEEAQTVRIESIGTTPQGRNIPILYIGTQGEEKVKVWIQACLHGNEPAGAEAICQLADYLLHTEEGKELLRQVSVALIPVANPDGYALQQRRSGSGLDLNRDQSKLADPVSQLLKQAYQAWNPQVALDIHEYTPLRKEFASLRSGHKVGTAADVLFLPCGHPNASASIRCLSDGLFRQHAEQALTEKGYQTGFYFTTREVNGELYALKDAKSPQSSSTFQALTNTVSLFVEIRGIGLGRTSFARRAECGFLTALSLLKTTATHSDEVKQTVAQAIRETVKGKQPVHVTFESTQTRHSVPFIDYVDNERFEHEFPTLDAMQPQPTLTRKRPKAYILPADCIEAVEKLRTLGIEVEELTRPRKATVEVYTVPQVQRGSLWEKIYPTKVKTETETRKCLLPAGSYLIPLKQKNGNLAATLLEPESSNGFVNFQVIEAAEGKELPVARLIK